jgi:acyl transferase domain-containing protein/phosphopantetheinyl transferase (holo-ACP synthase)
MNAVAITGMACMFPGAPDVGTYWHNILGKVDAITDPPPESWDPEVYYDPEFADQDRTYCKRGGYLGSLASFDPLKHGIPPVAVGGEPDQWLALRVAHDALRDAGPDELPADIRARTAVVLGKGTYLNGGNAIAVQRGLVVGQTIELIRRLHPEYSEPALEQLREELQGQLPPLGPETVPGLIPNIIVGRIANRLDLMGPAYTVDAACASSLVAVQHAVRDLLAGDCDLALAGGSQVWMPVATLNLFCRLGALSPTERLRAFDKDADGTLLGEGIGIVVLKRLDDAVRDSDRVYALIRGVGVASDGRGVSVMAPRVDGEELALRRAYESAGVSPRTVGLLEAHGTGTPVGDVVEIEALTRVFGERDGEHPRCAVGTVKSMISHTIPAAGVAGLIKTALALHHRLLPPTLHVEQPNPKLCLERTPFYINTETRPWIHGHAEPRRAGVNAFGFGGINAHAVLEEFGSAPSTDHRPGWETEVCVLEAESAAALAGDAEALVDAIESGPRWTLADLACSLGRGLGARERPLRLAIVASSLDDLAAKLGQAIEKLRGEDCRRIKTMSGIYFEAEPFGRDAKVAFVFPGEGAQYPNMLSNLCLHFPEARAVFDRIDRLYVEHPRGHLLSDWVFPPPAFSEEQRRRAEQRLMELDIAVESVLSANAGLHAVVGRLVPHADALLGHSTGEHSAAMASGALDLETDERLATFCHGLHASYADAASRHEVPGAVLLALGTDAAGAQRIAEQAGGELHLAMDNCPHQAVLVGEASAVARARELAKGEGLMSEQLPYDRAVHTPLFAPFAEELRAVFAQLPVRAPSAGLWSCTTAAPYPEDPAAIRELLVEHWTSPVRFRETIEALHDDGVRAFVEVGPRGNMTSFVQDILRGRPAIAAAADLPRRSSETQLNHLAAMLAVHDVEVDLGYLFEHRAAHEIDWRQPPAERGDARRATIPLSTAWPMLRVSPDAAQRLRPAPTAAVVATNGHAPGTAQIQAASAPVANPAPAAPPAPMPNAAPVANPAPAAPPAVAAPSQFPGPAAPEFERGPRPSPHYANDEATAAIDEHLLTMERFLQAGEEVMQSYLACAAPVVIEQAGRPLVGTIISWEPEAHLVARRSVDPATDRYLLDHTLGRGVSRTDPDLTALPLMPLAMSIEILAEAAACLLPDGVVTGLRDVRAHRWLAFAGGPVTLEVGARRLAAEGACERVRVELSEIGPNGASGGTVVEGTVLLAEAFAAAPSPRPVQLNGGRASRRPPDQLYSESMFHGPLWQGVRAIESLAGGEAQASLQVMPRIGLLREAPDPNFVLDPVVLDAAGQVIGFWAAEVLDHARVVFPFRLAALDIHGPPRPPGERLTCTAQINLQGEALVRSDVEVIDAAGGCWMRLTGWEDKRFEVPEQFRGLTHPGELITLSTAWARPASAYAEQAVSCRKIEARLPADAALWKAVWASRVLGRRERELFAALRTPDARQVEWLGARTAAKEAIADLLRIADGLELLPADIEILPDERGCPVVVAAGLDELDVQPIVSLAHTKGRAAALAALVPRGSKAGIGIDLEHLAPQPEGFAHAALTRAESQLLGEDASEEWVLRLWSAKEAAGKSVGSGLAPGVAAPVVSAIDRGREEVRVEVAGLTVQVRTGREQDLVMATTFWAHG